MKFYEIIFRVLKKNCDCAMLGYERQFVEKYEIKVTVIEQKAEKDGAFMVVLMQ